MEMQKFKKREIFETESKFSGKGSELLFKKKLSSEISIYRCNQGKYVSLSEKGLTQFKRLFRKY